MIMMMITLLLLMTSRPEKIKDKDPSVPLFQYLVQAPHPGTFLRQNPILNILLEIPSE